MKKLSLKGREDLLTELLCFAIYHGTELTDEHIKCSKTYTELQNVEDLSADSLRSLAGKFQEDEVEKIIKMLMYVAELSGAKIKYLSLSDNNLGEAGAEIVASLKDLSAFSELAKLYVYGCAREQNNINMIKRSLELKSLEFLDCSGSFPRLYTIDQINQDIGIAQGEDIQGGRFFNAVATLHSSDVQQLGQDVSDLAAQYVNPSDYLSIRFFD